MQSEQRRETMMRDGALLFLVRFFFLLLVLFPTSDRVFMYVWKKQQNASYKTKKKLSETKIKLKNYI